jgi:hypothetical protein
MSENPEANDERPCLHCLIGDLISEFYLPLATQRTVAPRNRVQ